MRSFLVRAWILLPGCWALTGPREVSGPVGGSVSVQCQYNEAYQNYKKYWCRGEMWISCSVAVQTNSSEAEVAGDRVSIQDDQTQCTFTVTMESLALGDQDVYWCGIEKSGFDGMVAVNVCVFPAVPTSPPTTPEKDLTVATSPWTVPEVEKSTSAFYSSDAPAGIPNLVLHILIPSVLLVLSLIVFIAVKFRRASQRRSKALEDKPGQKDKNFYLYNKVSGGREAVSSGPEHCSATDQEDTYVNMCPITPRPPMICRQAKCGRKAAG